jgi:putative hydrolase of the HAD superfamily
VPALERLAARLPLAALSNGNACLTRIGLIHLFRFQLGAREHGIGKPDASIFHAACAQLGAEPRAVLHVGDDVELDVVGAHRAGLRTCWINREGLAWPRGDIRPDLAFDSLAGLADWLDAAHAAPAQSAA